MYMEKMTSENIAKMIDAMSVEELKTRLAAYMQADMELPKPVAIEVRLKETSDARGRYDVLLILENGEELEVKFTDRPSRLIYIYTLLHPQGFQRRSLAVNNYKPLTDLYGQLYFMEGDAVLKSIEKSGFEQYYNQAVSQARVSIKRTINDWEDFAIARPQKHNGKTIIDFVANGGQVIIDNKLKENG